MTGEVLLRFEDDYSPDSGDIYAAATALSEGGTLRVEWPVRTQGLIDEKVRGQETIVAELGSRGGLDPSQYFTGVRAAVQMADDAPARLPLLWKSLQDNGGTDAQCREALQIFLRFANLRILKSLGLTILADEESALDRAFSAAPGYPWQLYNSEPGRRGLNVDEPVHSVNMHCQGKEPSFDVYAPSSLCMGLGTGDPIDGDLLVVWAIPQTSLPLPEQYARWEGATELRGLVDVQSRRDERGEEY